MTPISNPPAIQLYHCGEVRHSSYNCKIKEKAELARRNEEQERSEVAAWAIDEEEVNLEDYMSDEESYHGVGF